MIPKKIHYCWFGGNPLPDFAKRCIESWRKFFPDYEIIEWNEHNYDVHKIPYISQAYNAKKFAFVSDYARFDILYEHGGLYFDTDVEVIKPFDDLVEKGAFAGVECPGKLAAGLGLASPAASPIYKEILDSYKISNFINQDG
ncbi:MAG: glycosyltransferase, partial [Treponema sp.]|nr:glycosyltransferase [Treponema sp.]